MSNETIKLGFELNDSGDSVSKNIKNVNNLRKAVDGVSEAASKASVGKKMYAAYSGSTTDAIKSASMSPQESVQYGQARAAVGTGAASRDFAKQAQGLGGLVHVYATFAANLFAAEAAFRALKEAANTESMVKGLDQLGANSGKSLGTLSKQIADTTGGALSLRDAMTAVAQASSAGLGNKQITDLAAVAGKASQALGISMTDAVSRLSRGISKIEPELLDELGIFVKVDDATEKYALSVGKTAASLSDFEKRQAFANAVLEQGKQKFDAIEAMPNPYDKLLASVSNLATAGLTLVNKVLTPITNILAESPVALGAVITGIIAMLLQKAIPAISHMREGLKESAIQALRTAETFKASFGDEFQTRLEQRFKIPDITKQISKLEADLGKVKIPDKLMKTSVGVLSDTELPNAAALAKVNKMLEARSAIIDSGMKGSKQATEAQIESAIKERDSIQKVVALYEKRLQLVQANKAAQDVADKPQGKLDPEIIAMRKYTQLREKAAQIDAVANAASNAQIVGVRASWALLNQEIEKEGITGISRYSTLAKGGLAAVGSRLLGIISAWGVVGQAIGIAIAAYEAFDTIASKAAKQQQEFNNKTEETANAVKTVNDTFDLYSIKKKEAFSIDAISAFTTALSGVVGSFDSQLLALKKFNEAANSYDVFKDKIADFFGKGNLDKLEKAAIDASQSIIKSLEFSSNKAEDLNLIAKAFGVNVVDINNLKELEKSFSNLSSSEKQQKLSKIKDTFKDIEEQEQFTTNAAKAFVESLGTIGKLVDQMVQANAFTDLQGKLGVELVVASQKLGQALLDPLKALEDIAKLAKDPKALAILGNVNMSDLAKATELTKDLSKAERDRAEASSAVEAAKRGKGPEASKLEEKTVLGLKNYNTNDLRKAIELDIQNTNAAVVKANTRLDSMRRMAESFSIQQAGLVAKLADAGFEKIELGLKRVQETADIAVKRTSLGILSNLGVDTAKQEYQLKLQEIDIQKSIIQASYDAQIATIANTEELSKLNAQMQINSAADTLRKPDITEAEKYSSTIAEKAARKTLNILNAKDALRSTRMTEEEVTTSYGKEVTLAAKSAIKTDSVAKIQKDAALALENAKAQSAELEKLAKLADAEYKSILAKNNVQKESLATETELVNLASQISTYVSEEAISQKYSIQQKVLSLDVESKRAQILAEQAKLDQNRANAGEEEYQRVTDLNNQKLANVAADELAKKLAIDINGIREKGAALAAKITIQSALELENMRTANSIQEAKIAGLQKEQDLLGQLGFLDGLSAIRLKTKNELQSQGLKFLEQEAKLTADLEAKKAISDAATKAKETATSAYLTNPTEGTEKVLAATITTAATTADQTAAAQASLDAANAINDTVIKGIELQDTLNQKLESQRQHLENIARVSESLTVVFGDMGKNLGSAISAFDTLSTNQESRAKQLKNFSGDEKQRASLVNRQNAQEMSDYGKLAGSVKSLFNQKSGAYKAFAAIEKTAHLVSIGLQVKETAVKISSWWSEVSAKVATESTKTATTEAGFLARLPTYITEIWASWGAMGPWMAAAAGVFIAAKLSGSGGRESYSGPTGEQFQKAQGTGQSYDAMGNLVDNGNGVFGDSTQKLDSINKSLEQINATSVKGLDYDNKMLNALYNVANAITGAATSIYSVPGLRQGTNFGTLNGTTSIAAGGLSGALDSILGGLTGGILGGVGSALFGGGTSVSTSVDAAGIQLRGTFEQVMNDTAGSITQYKDILKQFHEDGGWFGSDSDWTERYRETQEIQKQVSSSIADIFTNAKDIFIAIGESSGVTAAQVDNAFKTMSANIDINLKGLTGEDLLKELNATVSIKLNELTGSLFSAFDIYKKFGEDLLTTVVRVVDTNAKINQILSNFGSRTESLKGLYIITEAMSKAAGGLEKFIDQATFFSESFYTSAEQVLPVQKAVIKQLDALGLSSIDTKKEFRALVQGLDLTTYSGQVMYQQLMDLAPGFIEVTDAVTEQSTALSEAASNFRDFAKTVSDFRTSLVLSASSTATPMEKYSEAKTQFESTYALALSGDKDAMGKLTGISQTFLDMSKQFYASSDQYTADFNTVLTKLGDASISASASADVAQLQLDNLSIHTTLLTSINDNIAVIAGITPHAAGGYASGWSLVGEKGPEIVNFTIPGQVYTAEQTAGMFAGTNGIGQAIGSMVGELQQLREEVTQLRKDQQKQTGDLIISNYDANQKASEEIATAVAVSSKDAVWNERTKSELK